MVSDVSVGIIPKMKMNVTVHSPLFRGVFPHILCGNPEFFSAKPHLFVIGHGTNYSLFYI
mgnify:CR=1 FL=1